MNEEEKAIHERELQDSVKDLLDLQAEYYIQKDKCDKHINSINKLLGVEDTPIYNLMKDKPDFYKQLSHNEYRVIKHARKLLDLNIKDDITVVFGRKEYYMIRVLLEMIDELLEKQFNNTELVDRVNMLQQFLNDENNRCAKLAVLNTELRETISKYLYSLPHNVTMTYKPPLILTELLKKGECTDKEWNTCRVEKMGCEGCVYDDGTGKHETEKIKPIN